MPRKKPAEVDTLLPFEGHASFRTKRPSFADAIELLFSKGWPMSQQGARLRVSCFRLPSGRSASLVIVVGNHEERPNVGLPWCRSVSASDTRGNRSEYDPHIFQDALIDEDANVELKCGAFLHSCVVNPAVTPPEWTSEKRDVINQLIVFLCAERQAFAHLECRPDSAEFVPFVPTCGRDDAAESGPVSRFAVTNYAELHKLDLSGFKLEAFLAFHHGVTNQTKQRLSRQTLANILREAGIRIPPSPNRS